ncbi:hypothetical protein C9374_010808 [Naegleria lovaniensis]|uniref:Protein kinase domain-containing protein n=1 Tax=Naegleria lovaniensis TaxID=51637 RepID=A0AA88KFG7_NAELO|nr:uncharacterized protein C9374_010808 [Naegleria lovaniensis]KAG2374524.1 hypothetical protein C9374_010808 [Naegleria lovaniensis]
MYSTSTAAENNNQQTTRRNTTTTSINTTAAGDMFGYSFSQQQPQQQQPSTTTTGISWAQQPSTTLVPSLQNQGLFHLMASSQFRHSQQQPPSQQLHHVNSNNNHTTNPYNVQASNNSAVVIVSSGFGQLDDAEIDPSGTAMLDSGMALANNTDSFHQNNHTTEFDDINNMLMQFNSNEQVHPLEDISLYHHHEEELEQHQVQSQQVDDEQTQLERIMHIPLNDQRQYHHYQFDGCDFALPYRYQPLLRVVPPSSSSSESVKAPQQEVVFLGRGAYGQVIACADLEHNGAIVAIKKVPKVFDKAAYRMLREVKIMKHLRGHPNIVTLIDIFIPGTTLGEFNDLYIVSECMNGGDLGRVMSNLCKCKQSFSVDNIRDIMGQLLSAMFFLQSAGVLHRDMKPSNILLNQNFQLKLSDFGMSRSDVSHQQITNPQSLAVVTEIYRPPEVVLNYDFQSSAIDSWSIGCIFAELLYMLPPLPKRRPLFVILKDNEIRVPNHYEHLNLMASLLGRPNPQDLKGNPQHVRELLRLLENFPTQGYDFSQIFPSAPTEAIDLLKRFLTWNPETRISFEDALNHSFIRSSPMINRISATEKISSLDDDASFSSEKLRFLFYKEIISWVDQNKHNTTTRR